MKFSVLMSVYDKEIAKNLSDSLKSILINQSVLPTEVVLVKDGKLKDELNFVIDNYKTQFNDLLRVISLEENVGLGAALNIGLKECKYELVARMDSDDISTVDRFKTQLEIFSENNELDLVGGFISEFFTTPEDIKFIRKVPLSIDEIKKISKKKNPINHVTVMFKKTSIVKVGGYKTLLFMEDYYLWMRMILANMKLQNIEKTLVLVRTGESMFERRGDKEYKNSWKFLQKFMLEELWINKIEYYRNIININLFIYVPPKFKKYIYKFILRS